LEPNKWYWVKVDGLGANTSGNFTLSGRAVPANHTAQVVGNGTQIRLTTAPMGATTNRFLWRREGTTGHSFTNSTGTQATRTLSQGFNYITQIEYRCNLNWGSQIYRTAPQIVPLPANGCEAVETITCADNGGGSYTLTWDEATNVHTAGGTLSGYRIYSQVQGSGGYNLLTNPAVTCTGGECSFTLTGLNNSNGYNFWIETRCGPQLNIQSDMTSCGGGAPALILNNDEELLVNKSMVNEAFSFINAQTGDEYVDVTMHDSYGNFGLELPMIGDVEVYINDNNEITFRRLETAIDANFDFVLVPNPSNAMTTVHLSTVVEAGTFTVVDAMGRAITNGAIDNTDQVSIDAAQLQSGVYLVVVNINNQKMTKRLVVTK